MTPAELEALGIELPPTEDELPAMMDAHWRPSATPYKMQCLIDPLRLIWLTDGRLSVVMFIYFSLEQVRHQDFRGPIFLPCLGCQSANVKLGGVQEAKGQTS